MSLLPFDDRDGHIWFDGAERDWRDCKLHVLSHGLHYGSCVFEGERVYGGEVFALAEHTGRLLHSAGILDFEIPWSADEINRATRELISGMGISEGYVRPVAWRGSEMMGVSAQRNTIHLAIAAWEWPAYFAPGARLEGIRMTVSKWRRPAPDTAPTDSKAAGLYMICTLSKHAAEQAGFNDALMLDWRGQVAEATGANIFFVRDGELHTPVPDAFLDGITRRAVIGLARRRGLVVNERVIMPDELSGFSEAFLTGTAVEVTPVREIDEDRFKVGEITRNLLADYDNLVNRRDLAASAA